MDKPDIRNSQPKICLTVAGLDPSGGAGIIADIKTFSAFGCFATAAVASLTFQNTTGVFGAANQTAETVRRQIEPILQDFAVAALKTGMLPTGEIIAEVARLVEEHKLANFVVDPVVRSTSGFDLIDDAALRVLIEKLFPLAVVVTPNVPEAERIARMPIENADDVRKAARIMQGFGARNVLIKGGHLFAENVQNGQRIARDFLFCGGDASVYEADFIATDATHGTGCTLAAAIAANLANGKTLVEAIETAKKFVTEAIRTAPHIGRGHSPINQLIKNFD